MNELEPDAASQQWLWFAVALLAMTVIAWVTINSPL
jgi:IS1 family transposase